MEVYVDLNNVSKLLPAVLDRVTEINRLEFFQGLLKSIEEGILQNNITFHLMLDIGRCYSLDSISFMRYEQASMDFWITFAKIFKGKEINFLRGYRGNGLGRSGACITPKEYKINLQYPRTRP